MDGESHPELFLSDYLPVDKEVIGNTSKGLSKLYTTFQIPIKLLVELEFIRLLLKDLEIYLQFYEFWIGISGLWLGLRKESFFSFQFSVFSFQFVFHQELKTEN